MKKQPRLFLGTTGSAIYIVLAVRYGGYFYAFIIGLNLFACLTMSIQFFQDESNFEEKDEE